MRTVADQIAILKNYPGDMPVFQAKDEEWNEIRPVSGEDVTTVTYRHGAWEEIDPEDGDYDTDDDLTEVLVSW